LHFDFYQRIPKAAQSFALRMYHNPRNISILDPGQARVAEISQAQGGEFPSRECRFPGFPFD